MPISAKFPFAAGLCALATFGSAATQAVSVPAATGAAGGAPAAAGPGVGGAAKTPSPMVNGAANPAGAAAPATSASAPAGSAAVAEPATTAPGASPANGASSGGDALASASIAAAGAASGQSGVGAAPAPNGPAPLLLTVDEAVGLGLAGNPQIRAGVAGVAAARGTYRSQALPPNVNLTIDSINGTSAAPTLNGNYHDLYADFNESLDTSGQRRLGAANAKALYRAAGATLQQTRLGLVQQIRDAYWSLVAARAQARYANESFNDVKTVNYATHAQNAAGASPRGDVLRSDIDLANSQQSLLTAEGTEAAALSALNVLLARNPGDPITPADDLLTAIDVSGATAPMPAQSLGNVQELTRKAVEASPAVRAAREQVRAADYTVRQNQASRLPDLTVDYEKSIHDPSHSLVVGVHVPLFDFGSIRAQVRGARASREEAAAQEAQAEQQVAQQVQQAYLDYSQAQTLAASYLKQILLPSQTLLGMAQLGYKQGATGILPVLDAESTLRQARTGYINALQAVFKAQDELLAATNDSGVAGTSPFPGG